MRLSVTGATGALLLAAQLAHAEVTITPAIVTDYDFRGISQSEGDLAWQVGIDYAHESGFYAGAWGSTIDFKGQQDYEDGSSAEVNYDGSTEVDLIVGYGGDIGENWRWDAGATYYLYPGSTADFNNPADPDDDALKIEDYWEFYVGGGWGPVDLKYWYSPDLYDSGDTASYLELNSSHSLPWDLTLNLHVGYSFGDYFDTLSDLAQLDGSNDDAEYFDHGVGLARSFGRFDFEVKYVGTIVDGDYFEVEDGVFRNDDRIILSVSTTLPWADDAE